MSSFIMWYHSASHNKDRYFVGTETKVIDPCPGCGGKHQVNKPAWDYDKSSATIMSLQEATTALQYAANSGYGQPPSSNLKLEPIDETPVQDTIKKEEPVLISHDKKNLIDG